MARTIAISNQKGGVGKTTTAANLAGALAEEGLRVLCLDLDPQANLTVALGLVPDGEPPTMRDVMLGAGTTLAAAIRATETPGVDIVPSDLDLADSEARLISAFGRETVLRESMREGVRDAYDFILIDCPPTLGLLTINALAAAGEVIIPVQAQYFSLKGFRSLFNLMSQVRAHGLNADLRLLGLLPTFIDSRTKLGRDMMDEMHALGDFHVFATVIRQSVRLGEAALAGRPVTSWAPTSDAANMYRALAREVIDRAEA